MIFEKKLRPLLAWVRCLSAAASKKYILKYVTARMFIVHNQTMLMLAQELQTCGVFSQSHLQERMYLPGVMSLGTLTMSLNAQSTYSFAF